MDSDIPILITSYFPPIQYFTKLVLSKNIVIEQCENYTKQSYRNRCEIYGANGKLSLPVPIQKNHNKKTLIKDISISYDTDWIKFHVKSIESAYRSSPFYEFYIDDIFDLIQSNPVSLFDFNNKIITTLCDLLEIECDISFTKFFKNKYSQNDYRDIIHPKKSYILDKTFQVAEYYQVFSEKHGFIPNLSILDLLFNTGPESKSILMKCIK